MSLISAEGYKNAGVIHLTIKKTDELRVNIKDKLNTKSNKNVFVKNTIMTNIIKHCRGEKKEV